MLVKYNDIKGLVADATVSGNQVICKFKDPQTGQVILSRAEIERMSNNTALPSQSGLKAAIKRLIGQSSHTPEIESGVVSAFSKVSHQFELVGSTWRLKEHERVTAAKFSS